MLRTVDPKIDTSFWERWEKARRASLLKTLSLDSTSAMTERELLILIKAQADSTLVASALKYVFDYSRALGLSHSKFHGLTWEIADFVKLYELARSQSKQSCLGSRDYLVENVSLKQFQSAISVIRPGCSLYSSLGSLGCQYWREAIDGLVSGAGAEERFARHKSFEHDGICEDVFFLDGDSKRFGEIPAPQARELERIAHSYSDRKIEIKWLGLLENELYFTMESDHALCGTGGRMIEETIQKQVAKVMPGVKLRDGSPLAVYGAGTGGD